MGGCCEKRSEASIAKAEQKATPAVTNSSELPQVYDFITRYFTQSKNVLV